ncbi:hypothetical protein LPTSP4_09240 [Leptospira ryugenii]|uniref:Uncharacterized protein n=1 Tax=Leptospira ryugenii TaxID=1917863 RepID=A0A2P2DXQ5_9LEPT|nr:hypothetical protein [Leptospira ryugenii]GBF49411.1 hypothetical protein LPTSP4_09240 [Leptospira ryugenii]
MAFSDFTQKRRLQEFCEAQGCESFGKQIVNGRLLCDDHVLIEYDKEFSFIKAKMERDKILFIGGIR